METFSVVDYCYCGKCTDENETCEKKNYAIPTKHLISWAYVMEYVNAESKSGSWECSAYLYAEELADILHLLFRMGFQLVDCKREVDDEPVLYDVTVSWRHASKGIALRFHEIATHSRHTRVNSRHFRVPHDT